jgi:hypothetical protein
VLSYRNARGGDFDADDSIGEYSELQMARAVAIFSRCRHARLDIPVAVQLMINGAPTDCRLGG